MGCAVGHIGLASFLYFNQIGYDLKSFAFIPVLSLGFVVFIASAGIIPLSHVCILYFNNDNLNHQILYFCQMNLS